MMCDCCGPSMGEEAYYDQLCEDAGWENYEEDEIWKGSSGKILIKDMPDSYLNNAIAWLGRALTEMNASGWEMAPNGMDRQIGLEVEALEHKQNLLWAESDRRGLRPDPFAPLKPFTVGRKS